jgi:hypothetical protein
MYTTPSPDDLIEGVIISLGADIMPAVNNPRAQATVAMMQAILQQVRQTLPHYQEYLVEEHNGMVEVMRDVAAAIGKARGPEATRIRKRAKTLGGRAALPTPVDPAAVSAGSKLLNQGILDTMLDLDVLQRAGNKDADKALNLIRAHLAPRYARDAATLLVGAGMVGRG